MILTAPQDTALYPTLGEGVCNFIEDHLVFGPGDLRGQKAVLDDEKRGLIYRMYEVFPKKHEQAGRRRFKRCALSLRKGSAKTELAAWIAACELHPDAPVRTVGWDKKGNPIGGGVTDPYIPLVAYTEEQTEDLAYAALRVILELSDLVDDFDIGLERILRKKGDGKAVALATAPDSRDGARTTFQHFDETHRFTLPRLVAAHKTMLANIPKRKLADPWSLETTTAPEPGTGSVAEATMEYGRSVATGQIKDSRLFFFHREAGPEHDLTTDEGVRDAVLEASGPVAQWADVDSIVEQWKDPTSDQSFLERVWLNRLVRGSSQAFHVKRWQELARPNGAAAKGRLITVGFDGAQFHDSTGIVCTDVETGYQWVAGVWECPLNGDKLTPPWQVPVDEVDAVIHALFEDYEVWRLYADPPYWQSWIAKWAGEFDAERGDQEKRVVEWWTNRHAKMAALLENFNTAITDGTLTHSGDKRYERHIGNARRKDLPQLDEQGRHLWVIQKERSDSPHKIDLAAAGGLSWEARTDAIAAGVVSGETTVEEAVMVV